MLEMRCTHTYNSAHVRDSAVLTSPNRIQNPVKRSQLNRRLFCRMLATVQEFGLLSASSNLPDSMELVIFVCLSSLHSVREGLGHNKSPNEIWHGHGRTLARLLRNQKKKKKIVCVY